MASIVTGGFFFYAQATIFSNLFKVGFGANSENAFVAQSDEKAIVSPQSLNDDSIDILGDGISIESDANGDSLITSDSDANSTDIDLDPREADRITSLPGLYYDPGFEMFSGYLTVKDDSERNLFYWYVESQGDPELDPVVFWTNGGPACSGLLGFGTEHGPFHYSFVPEGPILTPNLHSWNNIANILYVEQPVGVGFSYSERASDYTTGDKQAAVDNYKLILQFLERFPERQSNDFYIASESYGGHYMPQLALQILEQNIEGKINFMGMMVGNPYVDPYTNTIAMIQAWYHRGLLPAPLYNDYMYHCQSEKSYKSGRCDKYLKEMDKNRERRINDYALDYPVCLETEKAKPTHKSKHHHKKDESVLADKETKAETTILTNGALESENSKQQSKATVLGSSQSSHLLNHTINISYNPPFLPNTYHYRPCADEHFEMYLNLPEVVEALHANPSTLPWKDCSNRVDYSRADGHEPQIHLYKKLVKSMNDGSAPMRMLVYSGDDDSVCGLAGTQAWIWDLGVSASSHRTWEPWHVENQTAGFVTRFNIDNEESSFTFATVHGAGHEVPSYRPVEALELFRRFLIHQW